MQLVLSLVALLLLWATVVGALYLFMLLMIWLTSRMLPLIGRRKR